MKVTRELKEILRRRLQKVYDKEKDDQTEKIKKKYQKVEDEMGKLFKAKKKADKEFDKRRSELGNSDDYYLDYRGNLSVSGVEINFNVDEHLYLFIEEIELSNDKEGILGKILHRISRM